MMTESSIRAILFIVVCLITINVTTMTLPFIKRMRDRQNLRRDHQGRIDKNIIHLQTAKGDLLGQDGEPYPFVYNKYADNTMVAIDFKRAGKITRAIDADTSGFGLSKTMLDYLQDIPTLEPL